MTAKFISNQRGGHKLIHEGHSYIKHRHRVTPVGEVTYWRCDQLHRLRCPGFAQTNSRSDQVMITRAHNHAPSSTRIEVLIAKSDIRRAAVNAISATPGSIVANALEGISEAAKHQLPKIANLKKTACRQRKSIADGAGGGKVHSMPISSKEALCKRVMQNYRRNAWGAGTVVINASTGGSRLRAADTVTAPPSHYDVSDPPLLVKTMPTAAKQGGAHSLSITSAALDVVLKDSFPFNFIERPAMRSLLKAVLEFGQMNASSSALLNSLLADGMALRMEMRRRVASVRNTPKFKQFIELLKNGGCLSYTFDESDGKSTVTIKGHVLNEQFELLSATLVFTEFSGVTLREPLAIELAQCLNEQLGFSCTDLAKMHHAIADGTIEMAFENASLLHVCLCDVLDNVLQHTTCPHGDSQLHNRRDTVQRLNELNKLIGRVRVMVFWICEHIGDSVHVFPSAHLRLFSSVAAADNRRRRFANTVAILSSFVRQLEEVGTVLRNSESIGVGGEGAAQMRREFDDIYAHKDELEAYLMATEPIVEWIEFFEESDQPTIHRALPALAGIESGLNTLRILAMQSCEEITADNEAMPNSTVLQLELCEAALDALDWNISSLRGAKVNKHLLYTATALDPSAWRRELPAVFAKVARWTEEEMFAELRMAFTRAILSENHRRRIEQQHIMPRRAVPPVKRPLFSCAVEMDGEGKGEEEEDHERDEVAEFVTFAKQYRARNTNSFNLFSYWNNDLASVSFSNLRMLARQILCVPGGHIDTERNFSVQNENEKIIEERNEAEMNMEDNLPNAKCHTVQSSSSSQIPEETMQPIAHFSGNISTLSFVSSNASTAQSMADDTNDHNDGHYVGDQLPISQRGTIGRDNQQQQQQSIFSVSSALKEETGSEEAFVEEERGDNNDQCWLMRLITEHDGEGDQQKKQREEQIKDELMN